MYVEDGKKMEEDKYAYLWAYSIESCFNLIVLQLGEGVRNLYWGVLESEFNSGAKVVEIGLQLL